MFTARTICSSALSDAPRVVCCASAGIHGGGSYRSFVSNDGTLLDRFTDLNSARTGCLVVSELKNYGE